MFSCGILGYIASYIAPIAACVASLRIEAIAKKTPIGHIWLLVVSLSWCFMMSQTVHSDEH